MSTHIRSNNPFASEAEAEFQLHINQDPSSDRASTHNTGTPNPSIIESNNATPTASPATESNGTINNPIQNGTSTLGNGNHDSTQTTQRDQPEALNGNTSSNSNNGTNDTPAPWDGIDDSVPDEPLPAYSEVDPNANAQSQSQDQRQPSSAQFSANNTSSEIYNRPPGPPPPRQSSESYQRPSHPPPHIATNFQRPAGPPPTHLSPDNFSPRLPPRPTSPRLPPRPDNSGRAPPRRNVFPGRTGATYSNTGAPPLPHRR